MPTESSKWRRPRSGDELGRDVLLDHGPEGVDAPRLADVGVLREAVGRAHDVGPQPQLRGAEPVAVVGAAVCSQYRKPRLTRFASCRAAAASGAGTSRMVSSR